jgi:flagellar basal body rod protein FlgG
MGRNRVLGAPLESLTITEDVTTQAHVDQYLVSAVPLTITLDPLAFEGDQVVIQDITNDAADNPITILASPGQTILNGVGASMTIATNGGGVQLTFSQEQAGWVPALVFSPGAGPLPPALDISGPPFDVLIDGPGYFPVTLPDSSTGYTLLSDWHLNAIGNIVIGPLDIPISPMITVPVDASSVLISPFGVVQAVLSGSLVTLGQIELAIFYDPARLAPTAWPGFFNSSPQSGAPVIGNPGAAGAYGTLFSETTGYKPILGAPWNLTIDGPGYFIVTLPDTSIGYTLQGSDWHLNATGIMVVGSLEFPLFGNPTVPIVAASNTRISPYGMVEATIDGVPNPITQLQLAIFADPSQLATTAWPGFFNASVGSGPPVLGNPGLNGAWGTLKAV